MTIFKTNGKTEAHLSEVDFSIDKLVKQPSRYQKSELKRRKQAKEIEINN